MIKQKSKIQQNKNSDDNNNRVFDFTTTEFFFKIEYK